jgi:hypothetical protein
MSYNALFEISVLKGEVKVKRKNKIIFFFYNVIEPVVAGKKKTIDIFIA